MDLQLDAKRCNKLSWQLHTFFLLPPRYCILLFFYVRFVQLLIFLGLYYTKYFIYLLINSSRKDFFVSIGHLTIKFSNRRFNIINEKENRYYVMIMKVETGHKICI